MMVKNRSIVLFVLLFSLELILNNICIFGQMAWAHPQNKPVRAQIMIENGNTHNNKGGYGYIASSEAESYESFRFGCTNQELQNDYACATTGQSLPQIADRKSLLETINTVQSAIVLQRLREQMAEKIIIEHASLTDVPADKNARSPWPKTLPDCLNNSSHSLEKLHESLPAGMTPIDKFGSMNEKEHKTHNKFNAMINSYSAGNLIKSMMLYDQLKVRRDYYCGSQSSACLDLNNQLDRIKNSYPMLYGTNSNPAPQTHLDKIHNAIYEIVGATSSGNKELQKKRGRALYRSHLFIAEGGPSYNEFINFESAISQKVENAYNRAIEARDKPKDKINQMDKNASEALDTLNKSVAEIQIAYRENLQTMLTGICLPAPGKQILDFIRDQPNVVRQLMADASLQDRAALRLVLCAQNLRPAMAPREQCLGVSKVSNKEGSDLVKVNRATSSWPFTSTNEYTIKYPAEPKGAPPTIQLTINFPTTIRPRDKALEFINSFKSNVQAFYNCSVGNTPPNEFGPATSGCLNANKEACPSEQVETIPRRSCTPTPDQQKINFEFNFVPNVLCTKSEKPDRDGCIQNAKVVRSTKMAIHQCYNAEMNGQNAFDCTKVREHVLNKCKIEYKKLLQSHASLNGKLVTTEFDQFLNNLIGPFQTTNSSSPANNLTSNFCNNHGAAIDNSQANTDHCKDLGIIVLDNKNFNCQNECVQAVRECRRPHQKCWSENMIAAYCDGGWDEQTGRFDGTPKPVGHQSFNRQDSENLTTNIGTSTFIHEIGHMLNLDDEYQDDAYPMLPQGEHDSMMNYSGPNAKFYPRHFNKMLMPARCVKAGPYAETGAGL